MNDEGIKLEDTKDFQLLGTFNNYWRSRRVEVFKHPSDDAKVVSVGYPMPNGEPIVCVEPYEAYASKIENNDWQDYY